MSHSESLEVIGQCCLASRSLALTMGAWIVKVPSSHARARLGEAFAPSCA